MYKCSPVTRETVDQIRLEIAPTLHLESAMKPDIRFLLT